MTSPIDRRSFLKTSTLALAAGAAPSVLARQSATAAQPADRIKKALGYAMIKEDLSVEDKLRMVKDVGFEGIEISTSLLGRNTPQPAVLAKAAEKIGVCVHGVVNSSNPDLKAAIDEAAVYGATSVLHVARASSQGSFMENYRATQATLREAIPHAEKKKVHILVENVWATFLIDPLSMARYIDELDSPYLNSYFDVGNVVRWGVPQHWIEVLGDRVIKIHIKEYNLKVAMQEGMLKGFDFPIGEGTIQWDKVRQELKKIDFHDWATAEVRGGDRQRLAEISEQMDRVLEL